MTTTRDSKFYIKLAIFLIFALIILGFAYLKTRDLLQGVKITIDEPSNLSTSSSSFVLVKGEIQRSTAVYLNDRKIFLDEKGVFNEKLILSPGYNIITLRAKDRFGREREKKLELVYQPKEEAENTVPDD